MSGLLSSAIVGAGMETDKENALHSLAGACKKFYNGSIFMIHCVNMFLGEL